MTEIRKSIVFKKISPLEFGSKEAMEEADKTEGWSVFPPGTHFSFTASRQAEGIYGTGNKFREAVSYGAFSGSWNLSFILDYNHLEPLEMVFESVTATVPKADDKASDATFVFKKTNTTRVGHYAFRIKQMNVIAGGPSGSDEVVTLYGCVAKQISISRTAQSSQAAVEMNGTFADMKTMLGTLASTDYKEYADDTEIAQYSCMFMDDFTDSNYVADVDSHTVTVENAVSFVYNTCKAFATGYYEGRATIQWNAQTYSNDPQNKFRLRVNSGGVDSSHLRPMCKGLKPMAKTIFTTYSGTACSDNNNASENSSNAGEDDSDTSDNSIGIKKAHDNSKYSMDIELTKSVVKSITYPKGESGKMSDALSSVDCSGITITVKRPKTLGNIWTNVIKSPAPTPLKSDDSADTGDSTGTGDSTSTSN